MSSWTLITLDTTAPIVNWGSVTGAAGGETLVVHYTLGGPEPIDSASLRLSNGNILPMAVFSDRLEVALPPDVIDGPATVRAYDDVLNEATTAVTISGVIPPVFQPSTGGGLPSGPFEPDRLRDRSIATGHSTDRTRVRALPPPTTAHARSAYTAPTRLGFAWHDSTTARSTDRTHVRIHAATGATTGRYTDTLVRRDGPNAEDEMIALGLL